MKAYNFICQNPDCSKFGKKVVKIIKKVEFVQTIVKTGRSEGWKYEDAFCDECGEVLEKFGGPIGGESILPSESSDASKRPSTFTAFTIEGRKEPIRTIHEMKALYTEMNGSKVKEIEDDDPEIVKPRKGRPRKVDVVEVTDEVEDVEDTDDED